MAMLNKTLGGLIVAGTACALSASAFADSISPETFSATIEVGETVSVEKTVTLDATGASKVDVYFLADNTGSMGSVISTVRSQAAALMSALSSSYSDIAFGVGRYFADPAESYTTVDTAYDVLSTIDTDTSTALSAMSSWYASGGGDYPEANFFALHQAASEGADTDGLGAADTGVGTGEATGWRDGAKKIIVWFGDAPSHPTSSGSGTNTVDQAEAIAALTSEDVTVVGMNSRGSSSGIDAYGQATAVTTATDGVLVNSVTSLSGASLLASLIDAIGDATATIDIELEVDGGVPAGLDVAFTCTDALGCEDVSGGESRTLRMDVTGLSEGTYDFDVVADGIAARESDSITVVSEPVVTVSEPSTSLLIGAGLLAFAARRKRAQA